MATQRLGRSETATRPSRPRFIIGWAALFLTATACSLSPPRGPAHEPEPSPSGARSAVRIVPLTMPSRAGFEENRGQWAAPVSYAARDGAAMVFLTPSQAVWRFRAPHAGGSRDHVRMRWLGANPAPAVVGAAPQTAQLNYARGRDASQWQFGVPLYARVIYRDLYPGIDLIFHDERGTLEYDLVVAPGADPAAIRLRFESPQPAAQRGGALALRTAGGEIVHRRPIAFQDIAGERREIAARYSVTHTSTDHVDVAFALADYDPAQPLTIDPSVVYNTTAPTQFTDSVIDAAADADGNLWLVGSGNGADFPVTDDAIKETKAEFEDGFVLKLNAAGEVVYATYFGGSYFNCLAAVDVDADGNAFLAGTTQSDDFPVTAGAAQNTYSDGQGDGFLSKLGPDGQLLYSTYFGGTGNEACGAHGPRYGGVAVAPDGSVYLLVSTSTSTEIPAPGAARTTIDADFFIVRFDADMVVQWGRFLGSPGWGEQTVRVRTDAAGNAYVVGTTGRTLGTQNEFPTTPGAFQATSDADQINFVVKFGPNGDILYSTFLGAREGNDGRFVGDLDVDAAGNAYVAMYTGNTTSPVTPGAYRTTLNGFSDLFIAKLNPSGSDLVYGTYLGGSDAEQPLLNWVPIAVDDQGQAYVGTYTSSTDYPQRDAFETRNTANVVTKINADGSDIIYSSWVEHGVQTLAVVPGAVFVAGRALDSSGIGALRIDDEGSPVRCAGDCDGDGVVRVNELVTGVGIALDQRPVSACSALDTDNNGRVVVSELVTAVNALLRGCL